MNLQVETALMQSGHSEPTQFFLGANRIGVVEVVDRWPALDYTYFKIQGDDGNTYILKHQENTGSWELTLFQSGYQA